MVKQKTIINLPFTRIPATYAKMTPTYTKAETQIETTRPQDSGQTETGQIHQGIVLLLVGNHKLILRFIKM